MRGGAEVYLELVDVLEGGSHGWPGHSASLGDGGADHNLEWLVVPLSSGTLALEVVAQLQAVLAADLAGHSNGNSLLAEVVAWLKSVVTLHSADNGRTTRVITSIYSFCDQVVLVVIYLHGYVRDRNNVGVGCEVMAIVG